MIDKKIIDVFSNLIPKLSELDKERLYSFAEGLAFHIDCIETARVKKEEEDVNHGSE